MRELKNNDIFAQLEKTTKAEGSLLKMEVLKIGNECIKIKKGDVILIQQDFVRHIRYENCPEDIYVVYNEASVFSKIIE